MKWVEWVLLMATLAAIGCGSGEASKQDAAGRDDHRFEAPVKGPFLTASDLQPASQLFAYNANDVDAHMDRYRGFSVTTLQPYELSIAEFSDSDWQRCLDARWAEVPIRAEGSQVTVKGTIDLAGCLKDKAPEQDWIEARLLVKYFFQVECPGVDLGYLDGRRIGDFVEADTGPCLDATQATSIQHLEARILKVTKTSTQNKDIIVESGSRSVRARAQQNGEPCHYYKQDDVFVREHCVDTARDKITRARTTIVDGSTQDDLASGVERFFRVESIQLGSGSGGHWFDRGRFDVRLQNWRGDVLNSSGRVGPSWIMRKDAESVAGQLMD